MAGQRRQRHDHDRDQLIITAVHHDVVIVGGGQAGISLAARLRRDGFIDVAVVDPIETHRYRPLLSYVGGGQAQMSEVERPQATIIPAGVRWYQQRVSTLDPSTRSLTTDHGLDLTAGDLVMAPGVEPDWDAAPGSRAAVYSEHGSSNYVDERATRTWELTRDFRAGRAVFVVADGPVPCAGAGLKPMFLAADHWRKAGVLDDVEITAVLGWDSIFGNDAIDDQLRAAAARYGITVITGTRVESVDAVARTLQISTQSGDRADGQVELGYDFLHLVPRHRAPDWVRTFGLAVEDPVSLTGGAARADRAYGDVRGMIDVDPQTLHHRRHDRVWALGDAANVHASRSGGALRKQAAVVADNITRRRRYEPLVAYDGYSTAPITVSRNQLVLAEFDRDATITPSVPLIDLTRTRRLTWFYDRYLQPQLYWHQILKGRISR